MEEERKEDGGETEERVIERQGEGSRGRRQEENERDEGEQGQTRAGCRLQVRLLRIPHFKQDISLPPIWWPHSELSEV